MHKIGGNITAVIQVFQSSVNEIGEVEKSWNDVQTISGFLDMRGGDSSYQTYDTKLEESTHIFIADYIPLSDNVKSENSRMIINNSIFDIMYIDNPMELNQHYEIYLKKTGG